MKRNTFPSLTGVYACRIALMAVIMLVSVGTIHAQQNETMAGLSSQQNTNKVRFGIKAGLNIASLSLDADKGQSDETKSVVGAVGGVTVDFPFASKWCIHSGLELSMKGFELELTDGSDLSVKANYLELPVEVGYMFNMGKSWHVEPRLGLYVAYGIGGKSTISGVSEKISTFGDDILEKFDYGVGVGVYFDNSKFVFGLHAEVGIAEANAKNFTVSGGTVHNSNIAFTVGYLF